MTSMNTYKQAVLRRAEQQMTARRRTRNRCVAVCMPLCLVITLTALIVGGRSMLPPVSYDGSADLSTAGGTSAPVEIYTADEVIRVTDEAEAERLYKALCALVTPDEITDGSANGAAPEDFELPECFPFEDAPPISDPYEESMSIGSAQFGSAPDHYRITFADNTTFTLDGNTLTNTADGTQTVLTAEQYAALIGLLEEGET